MPGSNKPLLDLMSWMESSKRQNMQHPTVVKGPLKGQTAFGEYGLMPGTVQELIKAKPETERDEADKAMLEAPTNAINEYLREYPEKEREYASRFADKIKTKLGVENPEDVATSWLYGHNLSLPKEQAKYDADEDYANKIERNLDIAHPMSEPQAPPPDEAASLLQTIRKASYPKVRRLFTPKRESK